MVGPSSEDAILFVNTGADLATRDKGVETKAFREVNFDNELDAVPAAAVVVVERDNLWFTPEMSGVVSREMALREAMMTVMGWV